MKTLMLDDEERALLSTALRARPATVAELAGLCSLDVARVRELARAIERTALLQLDGDDLRYTHPHRQLARQLVDVTARMEGGIRGDLADMRALLSELPSLVEDWSVGTQAEGHALHVEVLHGADAGIGLWRRQLRRGVPSVARAVLPDLRYFMEPTTEKNATQTRFIRSMTGSGRTASAVISTADAQHPAIREQLRRLQDAGVELRMHPRPPSWFWVHDDRVAALPLTWGDRWPASVLAVYSTPIAAVLSDAFDRLWHESVPALGGGHAWDALLRLMRSGATLDAASRALGNAPRTGRRRIAAAMAHYGTQTLFGLGAAWAESGGSTPAADDAAAERSPAVSTG